MHKLGIGFAWIVAILAVVAVLFTAKMLDVRGSWLKPVKENQEKIQKNEAEIEAKEAEYKQLSGELTRLMLGWDQFWEPNVIVSDPKIGAIQVDFGNNRGPVIPQQQGGDSVAQPVIFAFQPDPNKPNQMDYVGAFRFEVSNTNGPQFVLVNPPQPGEVDTWKNGTWRLRALVPPNYISTLRDLRDNLVEGEQQLKRKEDRIQDLNRLLASAKERLEARVNELIGSDEAPQEETLPIELRKGLVVGLEKEEQLRNQEFQLTDKLRRDLLKVYQKQLDLVEDVSKLTKQLPQAQQK